MAAKRVKKNFPTRSDGIANSTRAVDRISKLPDPLIHHILSFVPTIDVVRMSILSRRWRRVWYSVPALHLSDTDHMRRYCFQREPQQAFYKFVDKCLKHRERSMRYIADSVITRFKLHTEYHGDSAALDNWLTFPVRTNVEELDLSLEPEDFEDYYCLPEAVLNARSLTVLKLDFLTFDCSCSVSLPSLISLSLTEVELCDEALHNLLLGCPALDKCLLSKCGGLLNPQISSSTLKFLEIVGELTSETIKVETRKLRSFIYRGNCVDINLSACKAIRNLSLSSYGLDNQKLEGIIFGLPLLECFTLGIHSRVKHFRICGQHLKSIRLDKVYNKEVEEFTIEAPNLVSFCYKGDAKIAILINAQDNILNGHIIIDMNSPNQKYDTKWYLNLIIFLSNINFSWKTTVSLHVYSEEVCILCTCSTN
ncbi:F-box domain containing protein [Trema orientale]|uniref:F-box domain containing protein n=1 Tax=Trema orientale TaxID=63057 RepID=A0A2P5D5Z3_TREOI|nr:F-box domain containing protein [Trema orientale]